MSNRTSPRDTSCLFCSSPSSDSSSSWTFNKDEGYRVAVQKIFEKLLLPSTNFQAVLDAKGGVPGFCSRCQAIVVDVQEFNRMVAKYELLIKIKAEIVGDLVKAAKKSRGKKSVVWDQFREPVISNYASGRLPHNPRVVITNLAAPGPATKVKKVKNNLKERERPTSEALSDDGLFVRIVRRRPPKKTMSRRETEEMEMTDEDSYKEVVVKGKLRSGKKADSKRIPARVPLPQGPSTVKGVKPGIRRRKSSKRSSDDDVIYEGTRKLFKACTLSAQPKPKPGPKVKLPLPNRSNGIALRPTKLVDPGGIKKITLPPSPSYSDSNTSSSSSSSAPSHKRSVLASSDEDSDSQLLIPPDERRYVPQKYVRPPPVPSGESEETEDDEDELLDRVPSLGLPELNLEQKMDAIQSWIDSDKDLMSPEEFYTASQDISDDISTIPYVLCMSLGLQSPMNYAFTGSGVHPQTSEGAAIAFMARMKTQAQEEGDSDMELVPEEEEEEDDDDVIIIVPDEVKKWSVTPRGRKKNGVIP